MGLLRWTLRGGVGSFVHSIWLKNPFMCYTFITLRQHFIAAPVWCPWTVFVVWCPTIFIYHSENYSFQRLMLGLLLLFPRWWGRYEIHLWWIQKTGLYIYTSTLRTTENFSYWMMLLIWWRFYDKSFWKWMNGTVYCFTVWWLTTNWTTYYVLAVVFVVWWSLISRAHLFTFIMVYWSPLLLRSTCRVKC